MEGCTKIVIITIYTNFEVTRVLDYIEKKQVSFGLIWVLFEETLVKSQCSLKHSIRVANASDERAFEAVETG